jgi:LuxR family transcriptional regulator, maltose regulon positive regulatory protein
MLAPPSLREGLVPRTPLVERLRPAATPTVVTVAAPAGYGKTTLLGELAARSGDHPFVWIDCEQLDDDAGALREALEAARGEASLTIAIDDVHLLGSEESRGAIAELAAGLSGSSRLLLAGRRAIEVQSPGRLVELGLDDLRMSEAEAAQLLRNAGVQADDEEIAGLTARAEGWPAGLYLAALVDEAEGQPPAEFTGADRFVREYVREECLAGLTPEDAGFLMRASVFDVLSGPICDGVLERSRSAARLERLARALLFVLPVANGRRPAYRLHRMFREALLAELRRAEPGADRLLAGRASHWCEEHGDPEQAVAYAWAAHDRERFAALVEERAMPLYHGGGLATLEQWLSWPDEQLLARHPRLAVWGALVATFRGRRDDALRLTEIAERSAERRPLRPLLAILRSAACRTGLHGMAVDARLAAGELTEESPWRPLALVLLGTARLLAGDTESADTALEDAHRSAAAAGAAETACLALAQRAALEGAAARWEEAEALATRARAALQEARLDDYPTAALTYAVSARSAVLRSDWVRTRTDLERAHGLLPLLTAAAPWLAAQVRLELARVHLELSDHDEATALLAQAEALAAEAGLSELAAQAEELHGELDKGTRPEESWGHLTPAELRLLPLLTTHLSFRELADVLHISRNTVKTQAICVYRKLGVSSRSAAIERASELGLIEKPEILELPDTAQ